MKTVVLGASHKPYRYSYMAVQLLRQYGHEVIAIGKRAREVDDWEIVEDPFPLEDVHTVTMYLNASNQEYYHEFLKDHNFKRVIFNPGAENPVLAAELEQKGVEVLDACTLVMLRTGQF